MTVGLSTSSAAERTNISKPVSWTVCALLFLATTLNYLDRQALGILAPRIQSEFGIDNASLGLLFSVFYYCYTLSQFFIGPLLDRSNLRWAYAGAVLCWSAVASLTGLAYSLATLMVFRALLGIAESANWPAAIRVVSRVLPERERTLGNGIFTSGSSLGALLAPGLILGLSSQYGWRWAFAAVGSLGTVWFLLWVRLTRRPELAPVWREDPSPWVRTQSSRRLIYREVLQGGRFWPAFVISILINPCLYFSVNWIPTYLAQRWGLGGTASVAFSLTVIYLGLDTGYLLAGLGIRALSKRNLPLRLSRRIALAAGTGLMCIAVLIPSAGSLNTAVPLLALANCGTGIWVAVYLTLAQDVSPRHVSTAAGLLGGAGSLSGALAMWAVGTVTQSASSFAIPFFAFAILPVVSLTFAWRAAAQQSPGGVSTTSSSGQDLL